MAGIDWSPFRNTGASPPGPVGSRIRGATEPLRPIGTADGTNPTRLALEVPLLLCLAVVIALVLQAFVAQAFFIPSSSMEPQLEPGDRVVVSRISYRLHDVRRGDIIVFDDRSALEESEGGWSPVRIFGELLEAVGAKKPSDEELIKRVVGLPGETVTIRDGSVFIDGHQLDEPYLDPALRTGPAGQWDVPAGHYFVMGDNRSNSTDSRRFGPIPEDIIVGRAIAVAWPPGRATHL